MGGYSLFVRHVDCLILTLKVQPTQLLIPRQLGQGCSLHQDLHLDKTHGLKEQLCAGGAFVGETFSMTKELRRRPHNSQTQAKIINEYKCDESEWFGR